MSRAGNGRTARTSSCTAPMRHQALSWIARHPSRAALVRLQEYIAWEPIPMLQRRGTTILERMSRIFGQGDAA